VSDLLPNGLASRSTPLGAAAAAGWGRLPDIIAPLLAKRAGFQAAEPLSAGIAQDGSAILQSTRNNAKSCFLAAGVSPPAAW